MSREHEINTAIDEVAREMTAGDASPNLRARVLHAIDRPRRIPWRLAIATACAACAVAFIVVAINAPHTGVAPKVPQIAAREPGASRRVPETSRRVPEASPRVPEASPRVPRVPNAFEQPPLEEESIAIERIALAPINPESIAVMELPTITPIAVDPLGPGEQK